jgi:hypothetical protein
LAPVVAFGFCAIVSANLFVYFHAGHRLGLNHGNATLGLNGFWLDIGLDFLNLGLLVFNLFRFWRSFGLFFHLLVGIPSLGQSRTLRRELQLVLILEFLEKLINLPKSQQQDKGLTRDSANFGGKPILSPGSAS